MSKALSRRLALKATGVSLSLPLLDAMNASAVDAERQTPQRLVFICTTLGLHAPSFWPKMAGVDYDSSEYLGLLDEHRSDMTIISGLSHQNQSGRRPHDSEATWLTSARNPGFPGFRNSVSVDQVAAREFGKQTRHASLHLSSNNLVSQSYDHRGVMIPARTSPSKLFTELFLEGSPEEVERQQRRLEQGESILDHLRSEAAKLKSRVSTTDLHLLDEYYDSVRSVEQNLAKARAWSERPKPHVDANRPRDVRDSADLIGRVRLLMNLIPLVLQTDSTRVITVMIQDHNTAPRIPGVTGDHHNLSHHGNDESKIVQLRTVESQLIAQFSQLLATMKSTEELGARLIDQTSILFGSNLGNANMHNTDDVPTIIAGGGFRHGTFQRLEDRQTPLSNLFVTMLNNAGLEQESFGQSTGSLSW